MTLFASGRANYKVKGQNRHVGRLLDFGFSFDIDVWFVWQTAVGEERDRTDNQGEEKKTLHERMLNQSILISNI